MPDVDPAEKERVRLGTLLALRARDLCALAHRKSKPWAIEQPPERPGKTSMYGLDEWRQLPAETSAVRNMLVQCEFGAESVKVGRAHV